jgi:flagellar protein FlaF
MGFSVSGATAVVLVGLLVCAATLYPAADRYAERRADAVEAADERALDRRNTVLGSVTATYDPANDTLSVAVENAGAHTLAVSAVDLLVDGRYASYDASVAGAGSTDVWAPGETVTLTRTAEGAPGRVKVVTGPGVAATATVEVG